MSSANPQSRERLWRLVILGSSILIFIVSSLYGFLHGFEDPLQSWPGYYTLAVDHSLPLASIDQALAKQGIANAMSANTAQVGVSDFVGISYRRLDSMLPNLDDQDPRLDGFVKSVPGLFEDAKKTNWVIYIPAHESIAPTMVRLSMALGPLKAAWQLMEWRPLERIGLLGAALAIAALLVFFSRKRRFIMIVSLLPWIPLAASVGPAFFALHTLALLSWALLLESLIPALKRFAHEVPQAPFFWDNPSSLEYCKDSLRKLAPYLDQGVVRVRLIVYVGAMLFFIGCSIARGSWELVPGLILVQCFAWPGLLLLLARLYQIRHHRSEHQLFAPIPILTRGRAWFSRLRPSFLPIAFICLAVPIAFGLFAGGGSSAQVPVPAGTQWGALGWANLENEQSAPDRDSGLPGIGLFVRHRAFQEALPYLQDYRWSAFPLPDAGANFGVDHFSLKGEQVSKIYEKRVEFGDAWLSGLRSKAADSSVDRLLLAPGRVSGLVFSQAGKLYSADAWSLPAMAGLLCILVPLFIWGRDAGIRQFYGSRRTPSGSRKIAA